MIYFPGGPQPSVLQEVTIPIWGNAECRQKYGYAAPGGIVDHMLCAGQASRDSCSVNIENVKNSITVMHITHISIIRVIVADL